MAKKKVISEENCAETQPKTSAFKDCYSKKFGTFKKEI